MSAPSNVTFTQSRSWLTGRRKSTYSVTSPCTELALSRIIHGFMQLVVPEILHPATGELLHNIKGRNPTNRLLSELPIPLRDETFCVGGKIARVLADNELQWEDFSISSLSHFKNFSGETAIVFTPESMRTSNIPSWLPSRLIGAAAPVHPRFFRFAVEHFRTLRSFASISAMPEVTESLIVDCSESLLSLRITIESRKQISPELLDSVPCLSSSSRMLSRIFGWNFYEDLKSRGYRQ